MRIAIVGGGISGLATAFFVHRQAPSTELTLFEAAPRLGGTMRTEEVGGFLFETGSNGFLTNKPDTLDLVHHSGADPLLLPSSDAARIRYIYSDRLHRLPESPGAFLGSGLLSPFGKLRVAAEVLIPPRRDQGEESLQSFGYRRVGREFTDCFLDAMSAGIYAATPASLSVNAAFPAVVRLEQDYGGLFRGMIRKRKREAGPGGILMSFSGGVSRFIDHLGALLGDAVHIGCAVTGIEPDGDGYRLNVGDSSQVFDQVVLATPSYTAAELLDGIDKPLAARLREIGYSPVSVVGLGYHDLDHPLNGFGLLTTTAAALPILGVLWDSSIFPDRAPPGAKSLRVMIGGQRNPELALREEAELIEIARDGVGTTMGVTATPEVGFVQRWERGIPNYTVGHLGRVGAIYDRLAAYPGLHLNSNAYRGIGLNDCVANARSCAEQVLKQG